MITRHFGEENISTKLQLGSYRFFLEKKGLLIIPPGENPSVNRGLEVELIELAGGSVGGVVR